MVVALETLIDKQDTFEIVRDQVAALLVENIAAQKILAAAANKDPTLWDLLVFTEASAPWEFYLPGPPPVPAPPIVNVWYESGSFDRSKSDVVRRQAHQGVVNVDVYGFASATVDRDDATKHRPADREAAFTAQRGIRLVRNILMAGPNTYLQLRGTVAGRWPTSIQSFQPELADDAALRVIGMRLSLLVDFNEFSPQEVLGTLDEVGVDIHRAFDGRIVVQAEFDALEEVSQLVSLAHTGIPDLLRDGTTLPSLGFANIWTAAVLWKPDGLGFGDGYSPLSIHGPAPFKNQITLVNGPNANDLRVFVLREDGLDIKFYEWTGVVTLNQWELTVVTWDGVTLRLYQNGTEVLPTLKIIDDTGEMADDVGRTVITSRFSGRSHSVGLWDIAFTPAKVAAFSAEPLAQWDDALHWFRLGLDATSIGKDYGTLRGSGIDLTLDAVGIDSSDIVSDYPGA